MCTDETMMLPGRDRIHEWLASVMVNVSVYDAGNDDVGIDIDLHRS